LAEAGRGASCLSQNQRLATRRLARLGSLTLLTVRGSFRHGFKSTLNFATALYNCRRLVPGAYAAGGGCRRFHGDPVRLRARTQHTQAVRAAGQLFHNSAFQNHHQRHIICRGLAPRDIYKMRLGEARASAKISASRLALTPQPTLKNTARARAGPCPQAPSVTRAVCDSSLCARECDATEPVAPDFRFSVAAPVPDGLGSDSCACPLLFVVIAAPASNSLLKFSLAPCTGTVNTPGGLFSLEGRNGTAQLHSTPQAEPNFLP
jgi:hypothetical protein